jgi:hypothetical protein
MVIYDVIFRLQLWLIDFTVVMYTFISSISLDSGKHLGSRLAPQVLADLVTLRRLAIWQHWTWPCRTIPPTMTERMQMSQTLEKHLLWKKQAKSSRCMFPYIEVNFMKETKNSQSRWRYFMVYYLEVWTAQAMSYLTKQGYHTSLKFCRLSCF